MKLDTQASNFFIILCEGMEESYQDYLERCDINGWYAYAHPHAKLRDLAYAVGLGNWFEGKWPDYKPSDD